MAALTAIALAIFIIEAQIPMPIPIPGAKLGLANIVTLLVLFYPHKNEQGSISFKNTDALIILICRILLGTLLTGRALSLLLSLSGGILAFLAMIIMKKFVSNKQLWACGAIGAVFHNIGQILSAMLVTATPTIAAYLPILIIIAVATGAMTGLVAQLTLKKLP